MRRTRRRRTWRRGIRWLPGAGVGAGWPGSKGAERGQAAAPRTVRRRRPPAAPVARGGIPAQERELGAQGRQTVRRLLEAGLAEFDERGFQAVRVDDVVRRAKTSHGTF